MRSLIWIAAVLCGQLAFGQIGPVSMGAKVGVPLSDSFDFKAPDSCSPVVCTVLNYSSKTKRFTAGTISQVREPTDGISRCW